MLFLVILGTGFEGVFRYRSDVTYMEFVGPGVVGMSLLFSSMFGGLGVLWDKQFGFLKEILVAPVSRLSIVTGQTVGAVSTSMIKGMIFLGILVGGGLVSGNPLGVLMALGFMCLISASFVGLGLAFATRMSDPQGFQLVMNFLIMPVFFLSGALFPIDQLPYWLSILTLINPLTYGVDGIRYSLSCPHHFSPLVSFLALLGFWIGVATVAARLFKGMKV
jgi:ABC-2 type transport system permease protein